MRVEDIELSLIRESDFHLRTDIRGQDFEKLKESIKTHGVMQPILLRPKGTDYQIVAGTRRVEACKELGFRMIPAIVQELDDKTAFELALSENIQRNQLTPFEEARAFLDYVDKYKWGSITELAGKIHRSPSYIVNRLKLIELPKKITEEIFPSEKFTPTHAEELLRLERPEQMEEVAQKIKEEELTTSQTAEVVDLVKERKVPVDKAVKTIKIVEKTRERAEEVAKQLKNVLVETEPEKLERISEIVSEELGGLTKRLEIFPDKSAKIEPKFEQLRLMEERGVIPYTIWDFQYRDEYAGDKDFHGNCSPQIVEQCIWRLSEEGDLVVDPMAGSGTTIDVCKKYNRRCIGYDIKPVRDDIIQNDSRSIPLGDNSIDMIFIHPPYWNLTYFTKAEENLPDLSRAKTVDEFIVMLEQVFRECYRTLKPSKFMCVLLGDLIRDGRFVPLCRKATDMAEKMGFIDYGYAVKLAHGEVSRKKSGVIVAEPIYTNNLKISHDLVMFLRKPEDNGN